VEKYEREIHQADRAAKKWDQMQVNPGAAIKDAAHVPKQFEFERAQVEFQPELATTEAEIDGDMREIEAECGSIRLDMRAL
jgi:hypothetical protein